MCTFKAIPLTVTFYCFLFFRRVYCVVPLRHKDLSSIEEPFQERLLISFKNKLYFTFLLLHYDLHG